MPDRDARERLLILLCSWIGDERGSERAAAIMGALDAYVDERIANHTSADTRNAADGATREGALPGGTEAAELQAGDKGHGGGGTSLQSRRDSRRDGIPSPAPARDREVTHDRSMCKNLFCAVCCYTAPTRETWCNVCQSATCVHADEFGVLRRERDAALARVVEVERNWKRDVDALERELAEANEKRRKAECDRGVVQRIHHALLALRG